jgi:hypothetical protein
MRLPINRITPALKVLSEKITILPASGGAVEDLQYPDEEELEDALIHRETRNITEFAETPTPSIAHLYRPTPPLFRAEKHLYRLFIDGSLRTYYVATGIERQRSFPIELAQIGAAVMQRDDMGKVRPLGVKHRILLLIPQGHLGISDTVWAELLKLNTDDGFFQVVDTAQKTVNTPEDPTVENLRRRSGGIARNQMHELEIEMIELTEGHRDAGNWLILDGAVKLNYFIRTPSMIGVAKNFSKEPLFKFGNKRYPKDITQIIAQLPYGYRTIAFSSFGGQVAFWYVRIRKQAEVDYPLMGVVKVEMPLRDRMPIEAELADVLSRALVAERNVTPHGRDQRWHCHLYPIFLAEQAIKNQFYSQQTLMGMIRWPRTFDTTTYMQEALL